MHSHKLQRINPLGVSDPALMFGKVNASCDFEDGIFTAYFRKANKEHSVHKMTTWICLDAPLHHGWAEFLSSALDKGQVRTTVYYSHSFLRPENVFGIPVFFNAAYAPCLVSLFSRECGSFTEYSIFGTIISETLNL